ncbi:MAG: hypothetical protein ACRCXT_07660 [Paraclostridium sp.]
MFKCIQPVSGPYNQYSYFIGANPKTKNLPTSKVPLIDYSTFIGPFSSVIGDVTIDKNVFLACNVVVRADEGTPFYVGMNTNLQDGVIVHGLDKKYVTVNGKKYSVYIGNNVSCAHNSIVHGPCLIGDNTFVGVSATVFNAIIKDNCFVGTGAIVTNGVTIESNKFVPVGAVIDTQEKADALGKVPSSAEELAKDVLAINKEFPTAYSLMFGEVRCSCGLCCCNNFCK